MNLLLHSEDLFVVVELEYDLIRLPGERCSVKEVTWCYWWRNQTRNTQSKDRQGISR